MLQPSLLVAPALGLTILRDIFRMGLPVTSLIARISGAPFLPAVPAHQTILGIRGELPAVVDAQTSTLAFASATDPLLATIAGRDKALLTVRTLLLGFFHLLLPIRSLSTKALQIESRKMRPRASIYRIFTIEFSYRLLADGALSGGSFLFRSNWCSFKPVLT